MRAIIESGEISINVKPDIPDAVGWCCHPQIARIRVSSPLSRVQTLTVEKTGRSEARFDSRKDHHQRRRRRCCIVRTRPSPCDLRAPIPGALCLFDTASGPDLQRGRVPRAGTTPEWR
ncbi:uncharacterized protein [Physcomitrium patens]|uniref:uncharacterized protein n=1 Tax=Physcomitrium patens TaxID=3218 RepID=UPI003CCE1D1F